MKALARFIMGGHSSAALVATGTGLLALVIPFIGILSTATVGLVTLRQGMRSGGWLLTSSTLASSLIAWFALGNPWLGVGLLVLLWAPIWGLAMLLRLRRSWPLTLQVALGASMILVLALFGLMDDPVRYWRELFAPLIETLVRDGVVGAELSQSLLERLSQWMAIGFVAALLMQALIGLMIARAWQSQLYYPGGFTSEFGALRLHPATGALFLVFLVWGLSIGPGVGLALASVLAVVLLVQGFAIIHGALALLGVHHGWLGALYLVWLLFLPQITLFLVGLGLLDPWLDLRTRLARLRSKGT